MQRAVQVLPYGNATRYKLACGHMRVDKIHFDARLFDPGWFRPAGIAFPDSIRGSTTKRQAEFFFGRLAARYATSRLGHPDTVHINPDRSPAWPGRLQGSLSHCRNRAVAIAMPPDSCAGAGIDIEKVPDAAGCKALRNAVVTRAELLRMRHTCHRFTPEQILTLVFSAKESFFKAAYPQIRKIFGFEVLRFLTLCAQTRALVFNLRHTLNRILRAGLQIRIPFVALPEEVFLTGLTLHHEPA